MTIEMDETFAMALRDLLVEQVQSGTEPQRSRVGRSRRWTIRLGAAMIIAASGGGIAYATGVFTTTPPGGQLVTDLAQPVTVTGIGSRAVRLGAQPHGSNAIAISFSCLTAGNFTFANGASVECGSTDVAGMEANPATYTLPIAPDQNSTTITATPGARWRLTATYSTVTTRPWGVNASGQTYGTPNQYGTPDLISAIGKSLNGDKRVNGYVLRSQLNKASGADVHTLAQARAWTKARTGPNAAPISIPLYAQDGTTVTGTFTIGPPGGTSATSPAASSAP